MIRNLTDADFRDDREKWDFLFRAPDLDAKEPQVRFIAGCLWEAADAHPRAFVALAMAYARDVILYQTDTDRIGREDIQPAGRLSELLARGVDDCDGKARLFVALCKAMHVPAHMVPHWENDETHPGGKRLGHVSAAWQDGRHDIPVELTLARARVGDTPETIPKETSGHWLKNEVPGK